jgi:hypothetical protein
MYPRRYFDDLVLESKITEQKILSSFDNRFKGTGNASKVLQEMMSSRMPFGVIKGKQTLNQESSTILPLRQTAQSQVQMPKVELEMRSTKPSFEQHVKSVLTSPSSLDPVSVMRFAKPVKMTNARNTFQARAHSITVVPKEPTESILMANSHY